MSVIQKFFLALTLGALRFATHALWSDEGRAEIWLHTITSLISSLVSSACLAWITALVWWAGLYDYKRKCWEGFFSRLSVALSAPSDLCCIACAGAETHLYAFLPDNLHRLCGTAFGNIPSTCHWPLCHWDLRPGALTDLHVRLCPTLRIGRQNHVCFKSLIRKERSSLADTFLSTEVRWKVRFRKKDDSTVFEDAFCPCGNALLYTFSAGLRECGEDTKASLSWQCSTHGKTRGEAISTIRLSIWLPTLDDCCVYDGVVSSGGLSRSTMACWFGLWEWWLGVFSILWGVSVLGVSASMSVSVRGKKSVFGPELVENQCFCSPWVSEDGGCGCPGKRTKGRDPSRVGVKVSYLSGLWIPLPWSSLLA